MFMPVADGFWLSMHQVGQFFLRLLGVFQSEVKIIPLAGSTVGFKGLNGFIGWKGVFELLFFKGFIWSGLRVLCLILFLKPDSQILAF